MKALITGGGGFCAGYLARYLETQGVEVFRISSKQDGSTAGCYLSDITRIDALAEILNAVRPDYVFHLAGITYAEDPTLFYRVNTQYAVALLSALAKTHLLKTPILLVGTAAEYGKCPDEASPIFENADTRPYHHYGVSKLAQTFAGLMAYSEYHLPVVVVRPFNIIGLGVPKGLVVGSWVDQIGAIFRGERPPFIEVGNLNTTRDFVEVTDVVKVYWDLLQCPMAFGEVINVCSGTPISIRLILDKLLQLAGLPIEIRTDPARVKRIDIKIHYGSNEKLRGILGYTPQIQIDSVLKQLLGDAMQSKRAVKSP